MGKGKEQTMSDLIRKDDVIKAIKPIVATLPLGYHSEFASAINSIPTAEPKVGRWIRAEGELICSICEYPAEFNPLSSDFIETNYCPNCGAKMEESR